VLIPHLSKPYDTHLEKDANCLSVIFKKDNQKAFVTSIHLKKALNCEITLTVEPEFRGKVLTRGLLKDLLFLPNQFGLRSAWISTKWLSWIKVLERLRALGLEPQTTPPYWALDTSYSWFKKDYF